MAATASGDVLLDEAVADLLRWQEQYSPHSPSRDRHSPAAPGEPGDEREPALAAAGDDTSATSELRHETAGTNGDDVDLPPERDWLGGPERPPHLEDTRPYGQRGGLEHAGSAHQQELDDAVPKRNGTDPQRFPDPTGPWIGLVNDGGTEANPLRGTNCLDCSLSAISTWHGEPTVSSPRFAEFQRDGQLNEGGETYGMQRAEAWLGRRYKFFGVGTAALTELESRLRAGGHGSSAHIVHTWTDGRTHSWNAFNYHDSIVWADPQHGSCDNEPIYRKVLRVWAIAIDRAGEQL